MAQAKDGYPISIRYAPRPLQIAELQDVIVSHIHRTQDLINLGCASKLLLDCCMRKLWDTPDFPQSPLRTMLVTFPEQVRVRLRSGQITKNDSFRVAATDFVRFDYYAKFVRSLTLWNDEGENFVASVLSRSRPGKPLFPALTDLHLGASGQQMVTAPAYFSPVLKSVRLNYWSLPLPSDTTRIQAVKDAFLMLCKTPTLTEFDLMDAVYTAFEEDPMIVQGFMQLAAQVEDMNSRSFVMLASVFEVLSKNNHLRSILLDLHHSDSAHVNLSAVITGLRDAFPQLRSLSLSCTLHQALCILSESKRSLEELTIELDGPVEINDLHALITSVFIETPHLRRLTVISSTSLEGEVEPRTRIFKFLQPLLACKNMQYLRIAIPFEADQSITDDDMEAFFKAWPRLISCIIETDLNGELIPAENEPTERGLTLKVIISALAHCSHLTELALPFLNCEDIPDTDDIQIQDEPFTLRLSQSHVHNLVEVAEFLKSVRPRAEVSTSGCANFPAARLPLEGIPPD
ncbi:hypothetical protein CALVIDRAFT_423500 [Calocera viscosa TUFC12733]|uniref:Uncharacterized protein n=1 Tax=Calocera viscosa (strain TUFC12733) TaxID=1330018 RepID=A0A167PJ22_CALVF|nr:hypothetical protein CALVIDRAFT_423500 [Calocera viscosa TUFC12733]